MVVLFSKPTTVRNGGPLPTGFRLIASEAALSAEFGRRFPAAISETAARFGLCWRIARARPKPGAIITGRYGEIAAAWQGLTPISRPPFILLDIEWHFRHQGTIRKQISRWVHRFIARGAWKIQVFCEAEAGRYAAAFDIPRDKFIWIPYCFDPEERYPQPLGKGYVFTGGLHDRDYPTLFQAVSGLAAEVRVAAPLSTISGSDVPSNVTVLGNVPRDEYLRQIANACCVVLSLGDKSLRFPGVITYVAAMRLGKCVIVNEPVGASSYISDGKTGILVKQRDANEMRSAIVSMLEDDCRRNAIAQRAKEHAAKHFTLQNYFRRLELLAAEAIGKHK